MMMPLPLKAAHTSGLNNSRNMIINLSQIKGQGAGPNITKQQLIAASTTNQAYSTIDYVPKSSNSAH